MQCGPRVRSAPPHSPSPSQRLESAWRESSALGSNGHEIQEAQPVASALPGQGGKPLGVSEPLWRWGKANPSFHAPWSKEAVTDSSYQRAQQHHPGHGCCGSGTPLSLCGSADGRSRCWSSRTQHVKVASLGLCCWCCFSICAGRAAAEAGRGQPPPPCRSWACRMTQPPCFFTPQQYRCVRDSFSREYAPAGGQG